MRSKVDIDGVKCVVWQMTAEWRRVAARARVPTCLAVTRSGADQVPRCCLTPRTLTDITYLVHATPQLLVIINDTL